MRGRIVAVVLTVVALAVLVAACGTKSSASTTPSPSSSSGSASKTLIVFGAGTLAGPWTAEINAFKAQNPGVTVHSNFASSGVVVKQVTQLHAPDDVLGVADYSLIPSLMYPSYASWYIGFVSNEITFAYTSHSKGASQLTSSNWYKILSKPGVRIGRSTPAADPSGYYILQMLKLAQSYYHDPTLSASVLKNSPSGATAQEETALNGALQSGQIDYLAIYRSDALQYHFKYIHLPAQINLSNQKLAKTYAKVSVQGVTGATAGKPITYGLTIPTNAPNPTLGEKFVSFVLSPQGQAIMTKYGFTVISPALASSTTAVPASLAPMTTPWPK